MVARRYSPSHFIAAHRAAPSLGKVGRRDAVIAYPTRVVMSDHIPVPDAKKTLEKAAPSQLPLSTASPRRIGAQDVIDHLAAEVKDVPSAESDP